MKSIILSSAMRDEKIQPLEALLIRQGTFALVFGIIIIPLLLTQSYTLTIGSSNTFWLIGLVALAGTVSFVFYYKANKLIGPVKAMAFNSKSTIK
ncbi:hypothetical protein QWY14_07660 [Planococcus sp. N028]|uniref:Uncharacterized protein n=1 Tax=Planococcus shixiaomingii TaxID=3058393 RepID=A0ABT8N1A4_9BACL|nr:hypothetical protein [Planococcus sp. N028]MDN7241665.1 hypothetical protein [Planococcus sp. N028]